MKRWDQIRRHFQTQNHCPELLSDGSEAQRRYKKEMQESWLAIPEQERMLSDKGAPSLVSETTEENLPRRAPRPSQSERGDMLMHEMSRDQTEDIDDYGNPGWASTLDGTHHCVTPGPDGYLKRPLLDQSTVDAKRMKLQHLVDATSLSLAPFPQ